MKPIDAPARAPKAGGVFSVKVVIALLLVGVFSFSSFFALSAFEPDLTSGDDGRAHALSRSAVGYAAAARLARARGAIVNVSRQPAGELDDPALTVLAPEAPVTAEQLDALSHQRVLLVLPKWAVIPAPNHPGWVQRLAIAPDASVAMLLSEVAPKAGIARAEGQGRSNVRFDGAIGPKGETLQTGAVTSLQTLYGEGLTPVVVAEDGRMILAQLADRPVYVLADPDFLNTQGIADIDNARVGMAVLDALRGDNETIVFDVSMNGFARTRSLLRLAFQPPFLAATLSLAAAAALLAWRAVARSGPQAPPRRAIALGKRALAENSAALIRLARREHKMGWGYAMMTGAGLLDLFGLGRSEGEQTMAVLDRVAAAQGVEQKFSELASEAAAAETGAQVLTAARKLHSWKEEMLRATR
ncbi:MAG: DUF4350 domain-containing protein [Terricaulis sp.]